MKQTLLSITMLILIFPELCLGNCVQNEADLISKLEVSPDQVCRIMNRITQQVIEAQNYISQIADSDISYNDKIKDEGLMDLTIRKHYINENAEVDVGSLASENVKEYDIKGYLQHLADLSYKGIYKEVKIIYYPDTTKFINANKTSSNTYSIEFQVFQEFTGCKTDYKKCYQDVTDKRFYVTVTNIQLPSKDIKINSVSVKEIYTIERYKQTHLNITP